jgi:hypothetical protein
LQRDICENPAADFSFRIPRPMLRLTDLKLPLDHTEGMLTAAILKRLDLEAAALTSYTVARRGHDARKRGAILLIYALAPAACSPG